MMIYEIVCYKVCHAICHMIFECVDGQAEMLRGRSDRFTFKMRGKEIEVEFNACTYYIKMEVGKSKMINYTNYETTDGIAQYIITTTEALME